MLVRGGLGEGRVPSVLPGERRVGGEERGGREKERKRGVEERDRERGREGREEEDEEEEAEEEE